MKFSTIIAVYSIELSFIFVRYGVLRSHELFLSLPQPPKNLNSPRVEGIFFVLLNL